MNIIKIGEEFRKLNEIVGENILYNLNKIIRRGKTIGSIDLIKWNSLFRDLVKIEILIKSREFKATIVDSYADQYIYCVEEIFEKYDMLASVIQQDNKDNYDKTENIIDGLFYSVDHLYNIILKIKVSSDLIPEIIEETWEPLPQDKKENNVENLVIASETRSMSLNDVASDVGCLDNFFKNISLLINQDQNQSNNIYLRRIETGSLVVIVSCAMKAAPIIAFIYWCVNLYQKTEKRYLDNADKKLEVINKSINIAKEILKVDPDNKEAEEVIQRCGVHLMNFLENNPAGTINGKPYDIGMEKPKLEDKENNS